MGGHTLWIATWSGISKLHWSFGGVGGAVIDERLMSDVPLSLYSECPQ